MPVLAFVLIAIGATVALSGYCIPGGFMGIIALMMILAGPARDAWKRKS